MNKSKYCGITGDELANMLCKPSKYSKKEAEEIIEKAEELTPLKALGKLYNYHNLPHRACLLEQENLPTYYEIIETELIRSKEKWHNCEVYLKQMNGLASRLAKYEKKITAFEIINEIFNFEVVKDGNVYYLRACCSASFINETNYKKIKEGLK